MPVETCQGVWEEPPWEKIKLCCDYYWTLLLFHFPFTFYIYCVQRVEVWLQRFHGNPQLAHEDTTLLLQRGPNVSVVQTFHHVEL